MVFVTSINVFTTS